MCKQTILPARSWGGDCWHIRQGEISKAFTNHGSLLEGLESRAILNTELIPSNCHRFLPTSPWWYRMLGAGKQRNISCKVSRERNDSLHMTYLALQTFDTIGELNLLKVWHHLRPSSTPDWLKVLFPPPQYLTEERAGHLWGKKKIYLGL